MRNILKKESMLYGIGHILSRLVSFLLLPIFTNLLTPYDYGIISLIYAFIGVFTVVLHFGLDTSLLRHYKPANNKDRIFTDEERILLSTFINKIRKEINLKDSK